MLYGAIVIAPHQIRPLLDAVEWDTLLFFASLFVFVESLAELGLIREVGRGLTDVIKAVPLSSRLPVAMLLVLWVLHPVAQLTYDCPVLCRYHLLDQHS